MHGHNRPPIGSQTPCSGRNATAYTVPAAVLTFKVI